MESSVTVIHPENKRLKIVVHEREGFSDADVKKHKTACEMLERVVNSVEFRDRLLNMKLVRTEGLSNRQLYDKIMSGAEDLEPVEDSEVDVHAEMYHSRFSKVIGYTYPDTVKTWINWKFFAAYDYAEVAGNLFHEWLHKLGFDHISATDYSSVPYALGYLVEDMVGELMKGAVFHDVASVETVESNPLPLPLPAEPQKKLVCRRSWRTLWLKKVCRFQ